MAIPTEIKKYLSNHHVAYVHKTHPAAYTAQEIAAVDHISGSEFAKTVVLNADGRLVMAVLPADHVLNMQVMKGRIGCNKLALASEREFADRFEPCRPGAMPPLGRLFGFQVLCDRALAEKSEIEFNAGTHIDTIRMRFSEFAWLEQPVFTDFARKPAGKWRARAA
jgi:Ala-tRNA(Pro) deacylase